MLKLGRMVERGRPIYAEEFNRLIDDLQNALQLRAGMGIQGNWTQQGIAIAAVDERPDFLIWARITAKTGLDPDLAENIRYDAQGIFHSACVVTNVYPSCGRPVKADQAGLTRIRPAKVGALCFIVQDKQPDGTIAPKLWFPGEGGEYEALNVKKCS